MNILDRSSSNICLIYSYKYLFLLIKWEGDIMKIALIIFILSLVFNSKIEISYYDLDKDYKKKKILKIISFLLMLGSFIAIILMV